MPHQYFVSKIHSRVEIETSELGLAAFEGRVDVIKAAIENGIHWDSEVAYLLEAAIHGNQIEIARLLLRSGMPVHDFSIHLSLTGQRIRRFSMIFQREPISCFRFNMGKSFTSFSWP